MYPLKNSAVMNNMMKDQNVRLAAAFVLGILVGVGGYWLNNNRAQTSVSKLKNIVPLSEELDLSGVASSTSLEEDVSPLSVKSSLIRLDDQNPGKRVVISQVVLQKPAWVAIHEDVDGQPGNVLGARLFDRGTNSGIIELLRDTEVNKKYYAVVHNWSGVKAPFNVKIDLPTKDENDENIMASFMVNIVTDR